MHSIKGSQIIAFQYRRGSDLAFTLIRIIFDPRLRATTKAGKPNGYGSRWPWQNGLK